VKQHLDSFNYFVRTDIKKIVRANDRIQATRHPHLYLRYAILRDDCVVFV
jgi:DNA-directed RNA polymerase III subunit RPC2